MNLVSRSRTGCFLSDLVCKHLLKLIMRNNLRAGISKPHNYSFLIVIRMFVNDYPIHEITLEHLITTRNVDVWILSIWV